MTTGRQQDIIRIDLTPEQQSKVEEATDRRADAIEVTIQELEARIAPRLASNHNETFLAD